MRADTKIGISGLNVAATKPERIGGIACAMACILALIPNISPWRKPYLFLLLSIAQPLLSQLIFLAAFQFFLLLLLLGNTL